MARTPKRLKGCKGCIYFNATHACCDYSTLAGASRLAQNAPLLKGGGCRLKVDGDKLMVTSMYSGKAEKRHRVVLPDGKVRYLKEDDYNRHKQEEQS